MSNDICWNCKKAYGECSWAKNFTPVDGWTAVPVRMKSKIKKGNSTYIETYHIVDCPEYDAEEQREILYAKRGRKPVITEETKALVRGLRKQGMTYKRIQRITNMSKTQVGRILSAAGMVDAQRRISLERRAEVVRLHNDGLSQVKIAKIMKINKSTIGKILQEARNREAFVKGSE